MGKVNIQNLRTPRSLSARRAWIEMPSRYQNTPLLWPSLSARRAWIEMPPERRVDKQRRVALRKESVDRNTAALVSAGKDLVALRKESVDRNMLML